MRYARLIVVAIGILGVVAPWTVALAPKVAVALDKCNKKKTQADALCGTAASCPTTGACSGQKIEQQSSPPGCDDGGGSSDHCVTEPKTCTKKYDCKTQSDGTCKASTTLSSTTQSDRGASPSCSE